MHDLLTNYWFLYVVSIMVSWLFIRLGYAYDKDIEGAKQDSITFWFVFMFIPGANLLCSLLAYTYNYKKHRNAIKREQNRPKRRLFYFFLLHLFLGKSKREKVKNMM